VSQVLSARASVAANVTSGNVLDGKLGQRLRSAASLRIGATGSAVGMMLQFNISGRVVIDDQEVSSINRYPQDPEDIILVAGAVLDDELIARFRNSTGGAITYIIVVTVQPVG